MKLILKAGYLQFVFQDTDTVTLTATKLSATETDDLGDPVSWESVDFTTLNSQLLESVTAEDFILGLWPQGPRFWNTSTYEQNMEQLNVSN